MTLAQLQRWLDGYVTAWKNDDAQAAGALFSVDAVYQGNPWALPLKGRDAIVAYWLEESRPEHLAELETHWQAVSVSDDLCVGAGWHRWATEASEFRTCLLLRFDANGQCREYQEWWIRRPDGATAMLPQRS